MSGANLDLVRSIYADWARGDFRSGEWPDPGIEFVMPDGPEAGSWAGIADMAVAWFARLNAWEDFRVEAEEYRELDDERVLVFDVRSGRGKTSGMDVRHIGSNGAALFYVRGWRVTRLVIYAERKNALADLGLEE
jgi:hypothetical protein